MLGSRGYRGHEQDLDGVKKYDNKNSDWVYLS
jgi:hypothetical protein